MQLDGQSQTAVTVPDEFDSAQAKVVYLYLHVWPDSTADDLCGALGINKGTVLSIVRTLRKQGYVERVDGRYRLS
ncbi:HTH domain protein [Natrialba magadii ATCC 43099]|uniref:HTH domain protein n=1 Tax=Natrialba magadii (strain ATCC 43099 / DSM 3394 / CCM 3739 / CIP 104546 / IAM 13178 / JCM 8861 / NBRC 102185 / NCIMB 2190 / MS3) TaxID=547559 RepID=D3SRQ9_NATMM|nr:helix-turn-helix domain-containing protein [Natrialba magadii]ADD06683.1 HTH domain protein [Natrialba magadii ATCC 43099]ELY31856.1 hypothetical protein C500_04743 [Natrialba magadii ATCC 43099]